MSHEIERKHHFGMGNGVDGIVIRGQDPDAGLGRNSMSEEITPTKEDKQE